MQFPPRREDLLWLARFSLLVEGIALVLALVIGGIHAVLTGSRLLDSFLLATFVVFLLLLALALLSGPGMFLARPKFAPIGPEGRSRWRVWLSVPPNPSDREFFELVLYTGLAFLLLGIAAGIAALLGG